MIVYFLHKGKENVHSFSRTKSLFSYTQNKCKSRTKSGLGGKGQEMSMCDGQVAFTFAKVVTSTGGSSLELTWVENMLQMTHVI